LDYKSAGCYSRRDDADWKFSMAADDKSAPPSRLYALRRGEVMTRRQLIAATGASKATFAKWLAAGLRPLAAGIKQELFLTDEVIETWIKLRDSHTIAAEPH
jgi:hypothetical protein